jgi:hypothetical protein
MAPVVGAERPGVAYQRSPAAPVSAPSMARASFASASAWQASQYGLSALPSTLPRSQPRQSIRVDRKGPAEHETLTPEKPPTASRGGLALWPCVGPLSGLAPPGAWMFG